MFQFMGGHASSLYVQGSAQKGTSRLDGLRDAKGSVDNGAQL